MRRRNGGKLDEKKDKIAPVGPDKVWNVIEVSEYEVRETRMMRLIGAIKYRFFSAFVMLLCFAAIGVSAASAAQVLARSSRGDDVTQLQIQLSRLDIYHGEIDGVFGKSTEAAVKEFQKRNNLETTGKVDDMTATALSQVQGDDFGQTDLNSNQNRAENNVYENGRNTDQENNADENDRNTVQENNANENRIATDKSNNALNSSDANQSNTAQNSSDANMENAARGNQGADQINNAQNSADRDQPNSTRNNSDEDQADNADENHIGEEQINNEDENRVGADQLSSVDNEQNEESAKTQIPDEGKSSDQGDVALLAGFIDAYSNGGNYKEKVALASVILNRVADASFPSTIAGVIYQPNAFSKVSGEGGVHSPAETSIQAARDAMNGWDPSGGALFFYDSADEPERELLDLQHLVNIEGYSFCR